MPLVPAADAEQVLEAYGDVFSRHYVELMCGKMGLTYAGLQDFAVIEPLLEMMHASRLDYTNLFRGLSNFNSAAGESNSILRDQFIDRAAFDQWAEKYRMRLQAEAGTDEERKAAMKRVNPKYILRNYLAQAAIGKAEKERDYSEVDVLLRLLAHPFDEQADMESYAAPAPEWARHIEVSCSS
jgi:uncharacterized protein YdiU (UPF0061 family)